MTTKSTSLIAEIQPRIIIHGGAGNIHRENLPKTSYEAYKSSLLTILNSSTHLLSQGKATALDVATHAVTLLENDPLFNCGKGAVFTRAGTNELEASVMVSNGYRKRGVGCMLLKHVKNPILVAREMLVRGELSDGGGAQGHNQLSGEYLEGLAEGWGLDMVEQEYFFTQKRWDEHVRGLEREKGKLDDLKQKNLDDPTWDGHECLPQGTVGAVVLDRFGTICVATSTGGLTNKLPGRIGDTPTLGAGFWAAQWMEDISSPLQMTSTFPQNWLPTFYPATPAARLARLLADCLPSMYRAQASRSEKPLIASEVRRHAVGMSGTGNGDSFLRINAVHTCSAISRFSTPNRLLAEAVSEMAGPGGELQKSAGDRWGKTGDGEGGIIGIELVGTKASIVWDFNCGGMFRAWVDDEGKHRFMVFKDDY